MKSDPYSDLYNAVIDDDISKVREILQSSDLDRVYHGKYTALITYYYQNVTTKDGYTPFDICTFRTCDEKMQ